MSNGWESHRLRDLIHIKHGFAFKGEHIDTNGPYVLVTPGNFFEAGGFKRNGDKQKRYSGVVPSEYILPARSLVVAMTEQAEGLLGSAAFIPDDEVYLHNQRIGLVTSDSIDVRFLYYLFNARAVRHQIRASSSGTKVRHTSPSRIGEVTVWLPPPAVQSRIADVLRAYDDLIEVNQRRIAILDEMARRLFDEWFVRFRYPGHEAVPLLETELGIVPEGWTPGVIEDLSSFIGRGLAPRYDDEASSLVINQKCIRDQSLNLSPARKQSKPIPPSKLVIDGDILINSTGVGTLGRVAQLLGALPNATVDTHVTIVRAMEQVDLHYFGLQLLRLQPHFERQGIGATGQTELSRTAIADTKIIIPTSDLASRFGRIVGPLRRQAEQLREQNNKLRAARDLLLPKLISGQIDVSVAEETFAEAAE